MDTDKHLAASSLGGKNKSENYSKDSIKTEIRSSGDTQRLEDVLNLLEEHDVIQK